MAITKIQEARNHITTGTSCAVTIAAPGAGNALVCIVACNGAGAGASGIVGGGVTWVKLEPSSHANYFAEVWYGLNSSGSGTTVTVTSAGSGRTAAIVTEWAGVKTASAADVHGNNQSAGSTTPTPGSLTESASGVYIYVAAHTVATTVSSGPTAGFTQFTKVGTVNPVCDGGYLIQTTPAAVNPQLTLSASSDWDMAMAVLLATPAATVLTPSPASSVAQSVATTLALPFTLAPSPAAAGTATAQFSVAMAFDPDAVAATSAVPVPAIAHDLDIRPDLTIPEQGERTVTEVPDPTVVLVYALVPDPVAATTAQDAVAIAHVKALVPDALAATSTAPAPSVDRSLGLTPSPVVATAAPAAPAVVHVYSLAPDALAAPATVPVPLVELLVVGVLSLQPVAAGTDVPEPALVNVLTLSPDVVGLATSAVAPEMARALQLLPSAVSVVTTVPDPRFFGAPGTSTGGHALRGSSTGSVIVIGTSEEAA